MATPTWSNFNIGLIAEGVIVGFQNQSDSNDLSETGRVIADPAKNTPAFLVVIKGYTLHFDRSGKVDISLPSSNYVGQYLSIVTLNMSTDNAVGSHGTRSSDYDVTQYTRNVTLDKMEPRDYFAVDVLNAMLVHMDHPEGASDATMMMYSRAAYRWAQAMMAAAADSREGDYLNPPATVDVDTTQLQTNTEKILYNISTCLESLEDALTTGIPVIGVSGGQALPVDVTNSSPIEVEVTNTPDVNVANSSAIDVDVINTLDVNVANSSAIPVNASNIPVVTNSGQSYVLSRVVNPTTDPANVKVVNSATDPAQVEVVTP